MSDAVTPKFTALEYSGDVTPKFTALEYNDIKTDEEATWCNVPVKWIKGGTSFAAAAALLAIRIFAAPSSGMNTLLMGGVGVATHFCVQQIPKLAKHENLLTAFFVAQWFLGITQANLNNNASQEPKPQAAIDGLLFMLFGLLVGRVMQLISNVKLTSDPTTEATQLTHLNSSGNPRIRVIGANSRTQRLTKEVATLVIATAILTVGYNLAKWRILVKFGWMLFGNSCGGLGFEALHTWRLQIANESEKDVSLRPKLIRIRKAEMYLHNFVNVLPAFFLAFNHSASDAFAGMCAGTKREIDLIRITTTPISELEELTTSPESERVTSGSEKVARFIKDYFWHCAVIGFTLWQGAVGTTTDRIIMWTSGAVFIAGCALARFVNAKTINDYGISKINQNLSPSIATAFFYLLYSNGIPLLFPAIQGWMEIGDIADNYYDSNEATAFATLAWSSLTWNLAMGATQYHSPRKNEKGQLDQTGMMLSGFFWWQNMLPLFHYHPRGA